MYLLWLGAEGGWVVWEQGSLYVVILYTVLYLGQPKVYISEIWHFLK